jgi:ribosome recycling factor
MKALTRETKERMQKSLEAFEQNVGTVRTGRANPGILNRVQVNYYGAMMPLPQVAGISSPDPRTLLITPFDKSAVSAIEKAIRESGLGFNPNNKGDSIFITIPQLNDERRRELVKTVRTMAEEARVAMRNIRRDANDELREMQKESLLTEDERKQGEAEVQRMTDEHIRLVEERLKSKEADILEV